VLIHVAGNIAPIFKYLEKPELYSMSDVSYSFLKSIWFLLKTRTSISKTTMSPITKTYYEVRGSAIKQLELLFLFKKYKHLFDKRKALLAESHIKINSMNTWY
jgi:hypothetical protein